MSKAWMPLYVADYLADTGHFDHEEHGIYLLAIMHYWQTGKPLPNNDKQLLSICRCFASERFEQIWSTVSKCFYLTDDGWRHKRIDKELDKTAQISEKRREAGRKGGKKTHEKDEANAIANAKQLPAQSQSQSQYKHTSENPDDERRKFDTIPYVDVVEAYHKFCPSLPNVSKISDKRRKAIRAGWKRYEKNPGGFPAVLDNLFKKAEASDFLTGRNGRFRASFDWLINESNMLKVIEGNYDNKNLGQTGDWRDAY